jgi:PAS domain S-box-containing protein
MIADSDQRDFFFLNGKSEITDLIKLREWSTTPLGTPNTWPQSLQTMTATMLENSFPCLIVWGKEFTQIYNDGFIPILGSKHPEALGRSARETFSEAWDVIEPMFLKVFVGASIMMTDAHYVLFRDEELDDFYFDFAYSPIRVEDGSVGGILVTVIETTNRRNAIDKLKESESRFKLMAENSDILIALSDESGNPVYFNKAWENLLGHKSADINSLTLLKNLCPSERMELISTFKNALKEQENWSGEYQILNKNQEYSWLLVRGTARFNLDNSFAGHVISSVDITQRKKSEEKLRNSEKFLRSIIEASPFPISILLGEELKIEFANQAILNAWGKCDTVIGKKIKEILPELVPQGIFDQLQEVRKTGTPFLSQAQRVEMKIKNQKEVKFYNSGFNPIQNDSGEIIGIFNTGADVTDLVLSKEKVEEAEAKARLAIDSAELGVYEFNYKTSEFISDRRFYEMFGLDKPATIEHYRALIHPDDEAIREDAHIASLATGRLHYQCRFILDDKSIKWVRVTGKLIYDSDDIPVKITGITQDITQIVLAQQQIEESERNMRNMVLQAPVAMCIFRGNEYIVDIANTKMLEIWGDKNGTFTGKPIFESLPEAKDQGFINLLEMVATTGERFVANEMPVLLPRDGKIEQVYVNFVYEPILQKSGNRFDIMAIATDVTPQVQARQKIEEVVEERTQDLAKAVFDLKRSNEDLAQFAYIASHDLQEPIRKITSFTEMLKSHLDGQLDEVSISFMEKITNASSRMSKLIRDVLTYSETGKKAEEFEIVNLDRILSGVISDFDLLIEQKGTVLNTDELPEIEAIPLQMNQLFGNLISNALKFSKKEGSSRIDIRVRKADQIELETKPPFSDMPYYHIQIKDNGIGFLPEFGEKIFSIFHRLHPKTDFAGTGIGLSMCRKIVQNHHGEINSKGSSENGAIFNIYLPSKQFLVEN